MICILKSFSFHSGEQNQGQNRDWVLFQTREAKRERHRYSVHSSGLRREQGFEESVGSRGSSRELLRRRKAAKEVKTGR
jgi:hypothetical protein